MENSSLREIVSVSGLPEAAAWSFLNEEFAARGVALEAATLDDLKALLVDLLQDLIMETDSVVKE